MHPIPVLILSGFLGAGKTTLLNYILHTQEKYKIAIIENEFGNIALDTEILSTNTAILHIKILKNGCICCNSRTSLKESLSELLQELDNKQLNFELLIIECTGMADPGSVINTFLTDELFSKRFYIKGTITIVDVINASYHFKHFNITQAQIGVADLILLSKIDLNKAPLEPLIQQIRYMNRVAPIHQIQQGQFELDLIDMLDTFNSHSFPKASSFTCHPVMDDNIAFDTQINSFVIYREKAYDAFQFSQLMNKILKVFHKQLIRYKGMVYIKNSSRRLILQGIHQIYNNQWGSEWQNTEIPSSTIVFIGIQLPEKEFHYFFSQI